MEKELYEMTYTQYYNYRIDKMSKDHGITKKECKECYPLDNGQFKKEYYNIVIKAAKEGKRIPNIILDQNTGIRHRILHDYNKGEYNEYITPEAREHNRQNKMLQRLGRKPKSV